MAYQDVSFFRIISFVQIIEGDKSKITQLYRNIKLDNRHTNVMTLVETATSHTLWDDWSMAFYNFTGNPKEDQHNRVLLESYFESASNDLKSTETFLVLRKAIQSILN